jgi:hypothetical protein
MISVESLDLNSFSKDISIGLDSRDHYPLGLHCPLLFTRGFPYFVFYLTFINKCFELCLWGSYVYPRPPSPPPRPPRFLHLWGKKK